MPRTSPRSSPRWTTATGTPAACSLSSKGSVVAFRGVAKLAGSTNTSDTRRLDARPLSQPVRERGRDRGGDDDELERARGRRRLVRQQIGERLGSVRLHRGEQLEGLAPLGSVGVHLLDGPRVQR